MGGGSVNTSILPGETAMAAVRSQGERRPGIDQDGFDTPVVASQTHHTRHAKKKKTTHDGDT